MAFSIQSHINKPATDFNIVRQVSGVECVLYFEVPDEVMVQRLLKRAETSGRVDDNEETIKKRLKTFHDLTEPVVGHYEEKGKVCRVSIEHTLGTISKV